ncbi:Multidrug efflux pump subunit AcrB [Tindallia magadiensis]|uniref:Multidrug efflux pump subunit AcrB n=1 Tax=Tindallia magadiensis TaxID=69895 RepID=A0A1I3D0D9_9FIRM|nr:efflux RND transporter permease subunit [Tindallia magadiensis]SFH80086.1 Multidrug efflux pump subunit AcrB [Tindallia magadiensis]
MTKWCIENRSLVFVLSLFVFFFGLATYVTMERQENPDVVAPGATVKTIYPGATPEDIEKFIVKPLEEKIDEITEVDQILSYSLDNVGVIIVRLEDMSDDDINEAWTELHQRVGEADLPEQAWDPEIDTDLIDTYGMLLTLSSPHHEDRQMKEFADDIKDDLERIDGVSVVDINGFTDDEIQVKLDLIRMRNMGITVTDIGTAMKARNVNIPGGNLDLSGLRIPVTITGEYQNAEEVRNTVVGMSDEGNIIYLRDVADVVETMGERETYVAGNGDSALLLSLKYAEGQNIVRVGEDIREYLETKEQELPEGMSLTVVTDQADYVNDAIKTFQRNLMSAVVLVVLAVMASMGAKSALVVSSAIPITVMATFAFMRFTDIILHQVSISSLILCLGLMVANAIVANDSMYLYMSKGMERKEAIIHGIREVRIPILTSTLTTVASFMPLLLMEGVAGKFVRSLPILVTVALLCSFLLSITVIPAMGYTFLTTEDVQKQQKSNGNGKGVLHRIQGRFLKIYRGLLDNALKRPKSAISLAMVILVLSAMVVPTLGLQLFPFVERDQYVIDVILAEGTSLDKTRQAAIEIERILDEEPTIDTFMSKTGDGIPKFYPSFVPHQIATNRSQFIVNGRIDTMDQVHRRLEENIPGARIEVKRLENAVPVGLPVQVRISGEDVDVLRNSANEAKEILRTIEEGHHVQDDYGNEVMKMVVDVEQDKASMVGLSTYDVASTVRMALNGIEVTKIKPKDSEDDIPVVVQIPTEERHRVEVLENIFVTSQITGENIPLQQVASIDNEFSLSRILRRDRDRTITAGLYPRTGVSAAELLDIVEERMEEAGFEVPPGYTLEYGGENEDRAEAFESLIGPFFLAMALIYIILMFQFMDLRQPLIIMGTIPLSFIGVIWGLKVTGYPLGFMALMGTVSLMGIVVNNGIVLLDYINLLVGQGKNVDEAIPEACETRLRPIMIGMITTVIGLVPMALFGGDLWAPLAYAIIFGLVISSMLTTLIIPAAFKVGYNRDRSKTLIGRLFTPKDKTVKE